MVLVGAFRTIIVCIRPFLHIHLLLYLLMARLTSAAAQLWPVVGYVNYKFVPIQYRVLVINLAALFW